MQIFCTRHAPSSSAIQFWCFFFFLLGKRNHTCVTLVKNKNFPRCRTARRFHCRCCSRCCRVTANLLTCRSEPYPKARNPGIMTVVLGPGQRGFPSPNHNRCALLRKFFSCEACNCNWKRRPRSLAGGMADGVGRSWSEPTRNPMVRHSTISKNYSIRQWLDQECFPNTALVFGKGVSLS
jgi:hypothetical protein